MMELPMLDVFHYPNAHRHPPVCLKQPKAVSSNKGSHLVSLPVGLRVIVKIMAKN